jgi:hypothetical protein
MDKKIESFKNQCMNKHMTICKNLGEAPCWGAFAFKYKNITIYVPEYLNNVARCTRDSIWDKLLNKHPNVSYITFTMKDI